MRLRIALFLSVLFVSAALVFAAETPIPASPTQWVTDTAGFMSPEAARTLDAQLSSYSQQSGHQLIVYIGQTTGDDTIDDWAVRAFAKWKVGRKGIDDGLVLFIMAQDHKLRFEVGYGLEGQVPDAIASRIINEVMVPRIQAGDHDGAVNSGIAAVVQVISGQGLPAAQARNRSNPDQRGNQPLTLGQKILYGIIAIFVLIFLVTHPTLAFFLLANLLSGGDRGDRGGGWGGGGGGGFGGGGGMSGGGGASGSW